MSIIPVPEQGFTEADAFCSKLDVEKYVGRGVFGDSSVPSHQTVLNWMAMAAAEIEDVIAKGGVAYTVPSRGNPFPTSNADAKVARLRSMCRAANIVATAARIMEIRGIKDDDSDGAGDAKQEEYKALLAAIEESVAVTETAAPIFGTSNADSLTFRSDTEF